jgi:2-dehydropantoate 2-reductase
LCFWSRRDRRQLRRTPAAAGNEVVARGAHLDAIRARGLTLLSGDSRIVAPVRASDRPADLGPQDAVLVTMKSSGLAVLAENIGPLLRPDTAVAFVQNGIPWWYGHGLSRLAPPAPDLSRPIRRRWQGGGLDRAVGRRHFVEPCHRAGVVHNIPPEAHALGRETGIAERASMRSARHWWRLASLRPRPAISATTSGTS